MKASRKYILGLMNKAQRVGVVVSTPVDPDCIATGLALQWWLARQNKQVDVLSFFRIPGHMSDFPGIDGVRVLTPSDYHFDQYQLVVLVDGCSWEQFFGEACREVLALLDMSRIVNLDHHVPDDIQKTLPKTCLNSRTSSTAQLLFEQFIKPGTFALEPHVAHQLYLALLYDTRTFKNEYYHGLYTFAEALIAAGADHDRAMDTNHDMHEFSFLTWGIEHTEFMAELGLTLLCIDAARTRELRQQLGGNWSDFDMLYKEIFTRQTRGYNYGVILTENHDHSVRLSWRTRNFGRHLSIGDAARAAGFRAGGHRNAGGGSHAGPIGEARARLVDALQKARNLHQR